MHAVIRDQVFLGGDIEERSVVHERLLSVNIRKRRPGVQVRVEMYHGDGAVILCARSAESEGRRCDLHPE